MVIRFGEVANKARAHQWKLNGYAQWTELKIGWKPIFVNILNAWLLKFLIRTWMHRLLVGYFVVLSSKMAFVEDIYERKYYFISFSTTQYLLVFV